MKTVFHLLRHASHDHVGKILTGRLPGAPLTPGGCEEALALGRYMAGQKLDAVYTSLRLRARQTADILARESGLVSEFAEALDEIDFGSWSGKSFAELSLEPAWRQWNEERDRAATPAGDTMLDAAARVVRLIGQLRLEHPGVAIALVSHSDVIKATICRYLGLPFRSVHEFEIEPASVTTLAVDDHGGTLIERNLRPMPAFAGAFA